MQLMYQHDRPGAGLVIVKAPKDIPVFVTVDGSFDHRSVKVIVNDGRNLAAWAGPTGPRGRDMTIEVGRPSASSFLRDFFGLRTGVSVSGGGVVASGRGSVASGGNIVGNAVASDERSVAIGGSSSGIINTGDGNSIRGAFSKGDSRPTGTGIHLSLPFHCEFDAKNDNEVTVTVGEQEINLTAAYGRSILEIP